MLQELAQLPAARAFREALQRDVAALQRDNVMLKAQLTQRSQPPPSYLEAAKAAGVEAASAKVQRLEQHVAAALEGARSRAEEPQRQAQLRVMTLRGSGATLASTPDQLRQLVVERQGPHLGGEPQADEILDKCGPLVAVRAAGAKTGPDAPADIHITAPDLDTHRPLLAAAVRVHSAATAAAAPAGRGFRFQRLMTPLQQEYVARLIPLMEEARSKGLQYFILYVTMDLVIRQPDGSERRVAASSLPPPQLSRGGGERRAPLEGAMA